MASQSMLFDHMQRYVQEVFAQRLRQAWFASYNGEGIHWFRLVNDEVLQAIYFVCRNATLQSTIEICYGCHPLFIPPVFQKSPYMYALPGYEQMNDFIPETIPGSTPYGFEHLRLVGMYNRPYRVPDVLILCPADKNYGLDILEKLLPVMDNISTPYACYEMHKKRREQEIKNGNMFSLSSYFIDEVLFWEDEALYPFCTQYVTEQVACLQKLQTCSELKRRDDREHLKRLLVLQDVFSQNNRDAYMYELQCRAHKNRILLMKHTGLK